MPTRRKDPLSATEHTQAAKKFADHTRDTAFSLRLGVREIRLLYDLPHCYPCFLTNADLWALHRLIDKGFVLGGRGTLPQLSRAGALTRKLLVLSGHIPQAAEDESSDN